MTETTLSPTEQVCQCIQRRMRMWETWTAIESEGPHPPAWWVTRLTSILGSVAEHVSQVGEPGPRLEVLASTAVYWLGLTSAEEGPAPLTLIEHERRRQNGRYDRAAIEQQSPCEWVAALTEELGEVAQAVNGLASPRAALGLGLVRDELVQVAAVAVWWLEVLAQAEGQKP